MARSTWQIQYLLVDGNTPIDNKTFFQDLQTKLDAAYVKKNLESVQGNKVY